MSILEIFFYILSVPTAILGVYVWILLDKENKTLRENKKKNPGNAVNPIHPPH